MIGDEYSNARWYLEATLDVPLALDINETKELEIARKIVETTPENIAKEKQKVSDAGNSILAAFAIFFGLIGPLFFGGIAAILIMMYQDPNRDICLSIYVFFLWILFNAVYGWATKRMGVKKPLKVEVR